MSDSTTEATAQAPKSETVVPMKGVSYIRYGEHVDTIESVDEVFRSQRRLSFTYGAAFFAVTLAIPALTVWAPFWYKTTIWGGFTLNYMTVGVVYMVFLWIMSWTYSKQADKLDERLMDMADKVEAQLKAEGALEGVAS